MTTDEILANPVLALALPEGSIPVSVMLLVEYVNPGSDNRPGARRLATISDDDMPPWTSIGMLRFAAQLELNDVTDEDDGDR